MIGMLQELRRLTHYNKPRRQDRIFTNIDGWQWNKAPPTIKVTRKQIWKRKNERKIEFIWKKKTKWFRIDLRKHRIDMVQYYTLDGCHLFLLGKSSSFSRKWMISFKHYTLNSSYSWTLIFPFYEVWKIFWKKIGEKAALDSKPGMD